MTDTEKMAALSDWGCDTAGALARTMDDIPFYLHCVNLFYDDQGFWRLGMALQEGNARDAFESAHALKGVAGNLGLTPLYRAVSVLVDHLRTGSMADVGPMYAGVLSEHLTLGKCLGRK